MPAWVRQLALKKSAIMSMLLSYVAHCCKDAKCLNRSQGFSDENEILRSSGLSGTARVAEADTASRADSRRIAGNSASSRKADDVRISYSAVRKVPIEDPGEPNPIELQTTSQVRGEVEAQKRVAIIYRRKVKHVFGDRLATILDETQDLRSRLESLPQSI